MGFADRYCGLTLDKVLSSRNIIVMKSQWRRNCTSKFEWLLGFDRQIFPSGHQASSAYSRGKLHSAAYSNWRSSKASAVLSIYYRQLSIFKPSMYVVYIWAISSGSFFCVYYRLIVGKAHRSFIEVTFRRWEKFRLFWHNLWAKLWN